MPIRIVWNVSDIITLTEREKRITMRPVVFRKSTKAVEFSTVLVGFLCAIYSVLFKTIGG